jgi:predicted dehydrogenase
VQDAFQPDPMKIGIVGYRNHAASLIEICQSYTHIKEFVVYHPDPRKIPAVRKFLDHRVSHVTSELETLRQLDAVLIASPSKYHFDYIIKLIDNVPYIFCEKPPVVNLSEISTLTSLSRDQKKRIYFNFHMLQTDLFDIVRERLDNNLIGDFVSSSMTITQGIAFKESMKSNWRFTSPDIFDSITGNLGVHYINMYEHWFGEVFIENIETGTFGNNGSIDTVAFGIRTNTGLSSRIMLSYAAPYLNERKFVFTDGYIDQGETSIFQYSPRDTFSEHGKFVSPVRSELKKFDGVFDQNKDALNKSVTKFLDTVHHKKTFEIKDFHSGLETVRKVLHISATLHDDR